MRSAFSIYGEMAAIVFFWALNWLVMKSGLRYASGLDFVVLRLVGASVVMALISLVLRVPLLPVAGERWPMAWIGLWQVGVMLTPSIIGLQFVGPGRAAVLVYTMQFWALIFGWLVAREKVRSMAAAGSLLGFCGLIIYMNPSLVNWHDRRAVIGNALVLSSGIGWAYGATLYRQRKWQSPVWTQTTWQILASAFVVAIIGAFAGHHRVVWTSGLFLSLAFNWIIATALCYLWWARALNAMPASRAGQIVSLVPVLALLMAAAWNGERLTGAVFVSMAMIGTGIVLTVRGREQPKIKQAVAVPTFS
jgi:drug/metabolite transporter (DMT)-like permease